MKPIGVFFLLILLQALLFAAAVVLSSEPELLAAGPKPHEQHASMLQSGTASTTTPSLWLRLGLGGAMISSFVVALRIGLRARLGPVMRWGLWLGWIAYLAIYVVMVLDSDQRRAGAEFAFGFPTATAWMLIGLWSIPLWFVALFVWQFDREYLSRQALDRFRARLNELRVAANAESRELVSAESLDAANDPLPDAPESEKPR